MAATNNKQTGMQKSVLHCYIAYIKALKAISGFWAIVSDQL